MDFSCIDNKGLMLVHSAIMNELYVRQILGTNGQPIHEFAKYHFLKLQQCEPWKELLTTDPDLENIELEQIEFIGFKTSYYNKTNDWLNLGNSPLATKPWICLVVFSPSFDLFESFLIPKEVFVHDILIEDSSAKYPRQLFNLYGEWRDQDSVRSLTMAMMDIEEFSPTCTKK